MSNEQTERLGRPSEWLAKREWVQWQSGDGSKTACLHTALFRAPFENSKIRSAFIDKAYEVLGRQYHTGAVDWNDYIAKDKTEVLAFLREVEKEFYGE